MRAGGSALVLAIALAIPICALPTLAVEEGVFAAPGLTGYRVVKESAFDADEDGRPESWVRRFRDDQGNSIFSMSTDDRIWIWSLDTGRDDDEELERNYVVVDSDCDGGFDRRYRLDEEIDLPACL